VISYIDICSGISAPTMAWKPLGWRALCFAEIDAAPRAVLAHHYPDVPLVGDFTEIEGDEYGTADLIVGGTPCQDFSVAGQRAGVGGERGNLTLEYARLARRSRARWLVWENVPGVFSLNGGRDFGAVLAEFAGYPEGTVFTPPHGGWRNSGVVAAARPDSHGLAWRVLDAQHFGVPQRRRRVFVVGYLGDWRRAAAVLLEREGLSGHPAPRREARQTAPTLPSRRTAGGGLGTEFDCDGGLIAATVSSKWAKGSGGPSGDECQNLVGVPQAFDARQRDVVQYGDRAGQLDTDAYSQAVFSITPSNSNKDYNARAVERAQSVTAGGNRPSARGGDVVCFGAKGSGNDVGQIAPTLRAGGHAASHANAGVMPAVAFAQNQPDELRTMAVAGALAAEPGAKQQTYVATSQVRRLTPRECERLQGFPDDFTLVPRKGKPMADGPRYKMLGNSMAVPVLAWIGRRIELVEQLEASAA